MPMHPQAKTLNLVVLTVRLPIPSGIIEEGAGLIVQFVTPARHRGSVEENVPVVLTMGAPIRNWSSIGFIDRRRILPVVQVTVLVQLNTVSGEQRRPLSDRLGHGHSWGGEDSSE